MDQLELLVSHYKFMGLNCGATLDEIVRQYKDLMILWHPDKHHTDKENYQKYEELTKQLSEAYNFIQKYHKEYGPPEFLKDHANDTANVFDVYDIPCWDEESIEYLRFASSAGICNNAAAGLVNVVAGFHNLILNPLDSFLDKMQQKSTLKALDVLTNILNTIKVNKHSICINGVSYSRKVNFVDKPMIKGGFIDNYIFKADYVYSAKRYLDYLSDNSFCGIVNSEWRLVSKLEIFTLLILARVCGYDVGKRKYESMFSGDGSTINGTFCHIDYFDYIPLNGKGFVDFINEIGFYNNTARYYWYEDFNLFDMEQCVFIDFRDRNSSNPSYWDKVKLLKHDLGEAACLWPVNSAAEQFAGKYIACKKR